MSHQKCTTPVVIVLYVFPGKHAFAHTPFSVLWPRASGGLTFRCGDYPCLGDFPKGQIPLDLVLSLQRYAMRLKNFASPLASDGDKKLAVLW